VYVFPGTIRYIPVITVPPPPPPAPGADVLYITVPVPPPPPPPPMIKYTIGLRHVTGAVHVKVPVDLK